MFRPALVISERKKLIGERGKLDSFLKKKKKKAHWNVVLWGQVIHKKSQDGNIDVAPPTGQHTIQQSK